jgi:hypothetical protein
MGYTGSAGHPPAFLTKKLACKHFKKQLPGSRRTAIYLRLATFVEPIPTIYPRVNVTNVFDKSTYSGFRNIQAIIKPMKIKRA